MGRRGRIAVGEEGGREEEEREIGAKEEEEGGVNNCFGL